MVIRLILSAYPCIFRSKYSSNGRARGAPKPKTKSGAGDQSRTAIDLIRPVNPSAEVQPLAEIQSLASKPVSVDQTLASKPASVDKPRASEPKAEAGATSPSPIDQKMNKVKNYVSKETLVTLDDFTSPKLDDIETTTKSIKRKVPKSKGKNKNNRNKNKKKKNKKQNTSRLLYNK